MEKNTVKFMEELEPPRCTAECHSGVPQQFLDEKEAEIYLFFSNFILFCLGETEL